MLPRWLPFLIAAWVIAFGIMRLRIATRKEEDSTKPNYRKGGYYARSNRSHFLFGISYLILGAYCIAMGFGFQLDIVGACTGTQTQQSAQPDDRAVPVNMTK